MKEENTYRQTIPSSTTGRYTALTRKAMRICYAAHEGQMDKSGGPERKMYHIWLILND